MTWRSSRGQPPAISTEHSGGNVTVQLLFMRAFPLVGLGIMPSLAALAGLPSLGHSSTQSDPTPSPGDGTSKGASDTPPRTSGSSILITNLLPFVGDSLKISSEGVYIGDGIPPVPDELAAKIRRGEFGELLPEFWTLKGEDGESNRDSKLRRTQKVTDIFTWIQCLGAYVSVRATQVPQPVSKFMAYMAMTVRVSQDYVGLAWVHYDAAFHRQAALTNNTRWSAINSTLYTSWAWPLGQSDASSALQPATRNVNAPNGATQTPRCGTTSRPSSQLS